MDPLRGLGFGRRFFINCIIAPYLDLRVNDWSQLITALTVILGISGARDVGLRRLPKNRETPAAKEETKEEE